MKTALLLFLMLTAIISCNAGKKTPPQASGDDKLLETSDIRVRDPFILAIGMLIGNSLVFDGKLLP
jgi:hypothetical protein